jgi:hypothetical protein
LTITKCFRPFLLITLFLCLTHHSRLQAQSKSQNTKESVSNFGYVDRSDSIEFVFGQQRTITIGIVEVVLEKRIDEINQVNVAGDFNGWNPDLPKYQMKKRGGTLFTMTISKSALGKTGELKQFKYVLNHKYWIEPPPQAMNRFTGKDGNTNLTLKL